MVPSRARVMLGAIGAILALAFACAFAASPASSASSTTTVSATVPSAMMLTNGCTGAPATELGVVVPGSGARTATGAGVCRVTFGSSNDTAQLRIGQADGRGSAMSLGMEAPTVLERGNNPGRLAAIFAFDSQRAFAVGRAGVVFRTLNGGSGWSELGTVASGASLLDVEARPGSSGTWWVTGVNRTFWQTTDGLAATPTWTDVSAPLASAGWPATVDVLGITAPDANTVVVVGEGRWIAKSLDAGATWSAFQHANTAVGTLTGIDAVDTGVMYAVDTDGTVLTTSLGGDTSAEWSVATLPGTPAEVFDVAAGSSARVYAAGRDGYVAAWNGTSWVDRSGSIATPSDLTGVAVRPGAPDTVWATDERGLVHRSTDVGATWKAVDTGSASRLGDVHAGTASVVFFAGAERSLGTSTDGGGSWTPHTLLGSLALAAVAASPTNGEIALAVGSQGSIRRTTNGGATWASVGVGGRALRGVTFATDAIAWAVGDRGRILRSGDGGATWTAQQAPAGFDEHLLGVAALNRYRVVAVGTSGALLVTSNGGETWQQRSLGTTRTLSGVAVAGSTAIAVGAMGTVARSTDAGDTWSVVPGGSVPDPLVQLTAVDLVSSTTGYVAVSWDDVWKTTDSGATWTQVPGGTATWNRGIAAAGSTIVAVGQGDSTARSSDGGATFAQATGGSGMNLASAAAIDTHSVYAVGADRIITRRDADSSASAQVGDWLTGTRDWDTGGFFGVCLQAVAGAVADWTVDTANTAGTCEAITTDPWRAIPVTAERAARTTAPGTASVDLVWGFRAAPGQKFGVYEAAVSFEAIAPNV